MLLIRLILQLSRLRIFVFTGLLFLIGCESEPQQVLKVRINLWPGYEPLYLAKNLGFFDNKDC